MLRISLIASVVNSAGAFLFLGNRILSQSHHTAFDGVIHASGAATKLSGGVAVTSGAAQKIAEDPFWLSLSDIGVLVGIAGVFLGVAVNFYFQKRRDARESEHHAARMDKLRDER